MSTIVITGSDSGRECSFQVLLLSRTSSHNNAPSGITISHEVVSTSAVPTSSKISPGDKVSEISHASVAEDKERFSSEGGGDVGIPQSS